MSQAAIWSDGDVIRQGDVQPYLGQIKKNRCAAGHPLLPEIEGGINLEMVLKKIKNDYVKKAYSLTGNQEAAAKLLGYPGRSSIRHNLARKQLSDAVEGEE